MWPFCNTLSSGNSYLTDDSRDLQSSSNIVESFNTRSNHDVTILHDPLNFHAITETQRHENTLPTFKNKFLVKLNERTDILKFLLSYPFFLSTK